MLEVDVGLGRDVHVVDDAGAGDMDVLRPALGDEEQVGAAVAAEPAAGGVVRPVPLQMLSAGELKPLPWHRKPGHERGSMHAPASPAVAMDAAFDR
jgi:hypothetical protein